MSQRVVSESVSDEDTAAAAEAVVVLRNSLQVLESDLTPHAGKERNDIKGGPN